jgi:hypothetical protein
MNNCIVTTDSYPYVTGMGFRNRSNLIFDEHHQDTAEKVTKSGQVAFVKTDLVPHFFRDIVPNLKHDIKIITHNSALGIDQRYSVFLNDPRIIRWYAQNANFQHPKLESVPLGMANRHWPHGDVSIVEKINNDNIDKDHLVYMNFDLKTNLSERTKVYNLFKGKEYVLEGEKKPFKEYITDLSRCKFTVSPPGAGIDCHRIWESIAVGTIPIVESCHNITFHVKMPIMVINDWKMLDRNMLENKYDFFKSELYNTSGLFLDHWIKKIGLKEIRNVTE